jgi:hypothetical protein
MRSIHLLDEKAEKIILLADKKRNLSCSDSFLKIVWAEDIDHPDFYKIAFKYDIIEFNTALKPFFTLKLIQRFDYVVYLDPDTFLFSDLDPVFEALDNKSIVLTPHATKQIMDELRPNNIDFMRFGVFNLGFYAVNNDANARAFLEWWHGACMDQCFYEPHMGMGVDQKLVDLAPCLFKGVHILKDPGYNLAFWNLHYRTISSKNGQFFVNKDSLLRFVHFSSYDDDDENAIAVKQTRFRSGSRPDFTEVSRKYRRALFDAKKSITLTDKKYGFVCFDNGYRLTPALRRFYAISKVSSVRDDPNPFASKKVFIFAKANNLLDLEKSSGSVRFNQVSEYDGKKRLLSSVFYLILKIIGVKRYFLLMKFFATYSSLLSQLEIRDRLDSKYLRKINDK